MAVIGTLLIVVATWLLNQFSRKWFELVLWPKIVDLWASHSNARLLPLIGILERQLVEAEKLPLLSEAEDIVLDGIARIYTLVGSGTHFVVGIGTVILIYFGKIFVPYFYLLLFAFCWSVLGINAWLTGAGRQKIEKYRRPRSEEWRNHLRQEIAKLRSKLS